jgi:hypothetical protein
MAPVRVFNLEAETQNASLFDLLSLLALSRVDKKQGRAENMLDCRRVRWAVGVRP